MSTWYVHLKAMQEPYDAGLDADQRQVWLFNILAERVPATTNPGDFEDEIAGLIIAAGAGTASGTDIFIGATAVLPATGTFITITSTSGMTPEHTQNKIAAYRKPTVQIRAHGADAATTKALALKAYEALLLIRNQYV